MKQTSLEENKMPVQGLMRTMDEVVGEMGVKEPNCAGISTEVFLSEMTDEKIPNDKNYAKGICRRCEKYTECPIALGTVSLAGILITSESTAIAP